MLSQDCPLCGDNLQNVIFENDCAKILFVIENNYAILRVVAQKHVKEMTDLAEHECMALMKMVFACESVFRGLLKPDKINLASLGNCVPHVHWHVIARFKNDSHFPNSIWAKPHQMSSAPKVNTAALQCALYNYLNK